MKSSEHGRHGEMRGVTSKEATGVAGLPETQRAGTSTQMSGPTVSVGLPVYNGERYVERAIRSILRQDYRDIELIVSDNGSTDGTKAVCRRLAASDPRLRYVCSDINRGAAWNFNHVVAVATGRYFKWASADDELAHNYISTCIQVLIEDASVVVAHPMTVDIDDEGSIVKVWASQPAADHPTAHERLGSLLRRNHQCFPVFGLMRRDVLMRTGLVGRYPESDDVLVAELALHGRIVEIPYPLFLHREHSGRSVVVNPSSRSRVAWFDPSRAGSIVFPAWRLFYEYLHAIHRSPVHAPERLRCYLELRHWLRRNSVNMLRNLARAAVEVGRRASVHGGSAPASSEMMPGPTATMTSRGIAARKSLTGTRDPTCPEELEPSCTAAGGRRSWTPRSRHVSR